MNFSLSAFDGFFAELSAASDEAIAMMLSTFNLTHADEPKKRDGGELYFGKLDEFNSTEFASSARGQLNASWYAFRGFFAAIDWTEPWIIGLCSFHVVILLLAVLTKKHNTFQIAVFCLITSSVYVAEQMNTIMAKNWKSFARQNYFDKRGVFISATWSTPLLLIAMVMLAQSLYSASSLLVQVKRKQLIHNAREASKESKKAK
mmetsp:Transcript_3064/g.6666  ORF Transcript_3064/g.6666 Transcript_3064/m.6666 type:complete len:204 (-) Transcript_3064:334-945(-)